MKCSIIQPSSHIPAANRGQDHAGNTALGSLSDVKVMLL